MRGWASQETTRTCLSPRTFVDPKGKGRSKNNYKVRLHSLEAQGHTKADANASFLVHLGLQQGFILTLNVLQASEGNEGNLPSPCLPALAPLKGSCWHFPLPVSQKPLWPGPELDLTADMWKLMPRIGDGTAGNHRGSSS